MRAIQIRVDGQGILVFHPYKSILNEMRKGKS